VDEHQREGKADTTQLNVEEQLVVGPGLRSNKKIYHQSNQPIGIFDLFFAGSGSKFEPTQDS
jgi:hypothetical protein